MRSTTKPLSNMDDLDATLEELKERIFVPKFTYFESVYGTRTSTVVLIDHSGNTTFIERDRYMPCVPDGNSGEPDYIPVEPSTEGSQVVFKFNIDRHDE